LANDLRERGKGVVEAVRRPRKPGGEESPAA
jgi:hypothetical protein